MKANQPKLKTQLFSCGFFRHCAQTVLSPTGTTLHSPSLPLFETPTNPPPPPPPLRTDPQSNLPLKPECESSSSSSSSSATSQSFTQWKFPLPSSTATLPNPPPQLEPKPRISLPPDPIPCPDLQEIFHLAELQLSTGSDDDRLAALHLLERSLVPNPPSDQPACPPELMRGLVWNLRNSAGAKQATKILFALCLAEGNRLVAVESGAVAAVIESAPELDGPPAERAMAALELMCTVAEGAAEVKAHALAVPVMVAMMGRMEARVKEYAIGVLAVVYSGAVADHPHGSARGGGACSVTGSTRGM
ncbi:RING-type E3 ubiquitin transferase [Quillaja saponaria]|uniref:RING-type E3 ubiquitin transferase n=1 Tax=Quillaja saponaria TaxID=32244 RepID=A0AAD7LJQ7_QUISA|nr:RING-type E3 ubiquitin transferase [Quillaja saponaria]